MAQCDLVVVHINTTISVVCKPFNLMKLYFSSKSGPILCDYRFIRLGLIISCKVISWEVHVHVCCGLIYMG